MSSGSIQTAPQAGKRFKEMHQLDLPLYIGSDAPLHQGDEVYLRSDGSVGKRSDASEYPIGTVKVGNKEDGDECTISTNFQCTLYARNVSGGAITPGTFLVPDGSSQEGVQGYDQATAGNMSLAMALTSAQDGEQFHVAILRAVHTIPTS